MVAGGSRPDALVRSGNGMRGPKPDISKHAERVVRTVLSLLFLLFAIGCASRPASVPDSPSTTTELTLSAVPEQVGGFRITETRRYPDPSAGTLYRFQSDASLQPDVYVYPMSEIARRGGTDPGEQAQAESALFKEVLAIQRAQQHFDDYQVVGEHALRQSAGSQVVEGWHVHAMLTRRGEQRDSHQHLFVIGEHLVKVRTNFPRGAIAPEELQAFLEDLIQGMLAR